MTERIGKARGGQGQHQEDNGAPGPGPRFDVGHLFGQVKLTLFLQVHRESFVVALRPGGYLSGWAMLSITAVVARISTSFSPGDTSTP